ncbi:MAG: UvrD-helicase domain-containing protein [Clostridia bacterium]|nr:UvrD-helicase domain-containing protein [Clostridia bacterium]
MDKKKKIEFSEQQRLAIDTRDRTLLVSAAAGSGKTATLAERIIQSILDRDDPKDLGKMLIVTFTNAAVSDLKRKITNAIRDAAEQQAHLGLCDESARALARSLEEQYLRVKDAKIVTINSFCNEILRQCAEDVGLSPTYRIADPVEAALIAKNLIDAMIGAALADELPEVCAREEFERLADGLVPVRSDDDLSDVFLYLYDKLSNEKRGLDTLCDLLDKYKLGAGGFSATEQFKLIREHLFEYIDFVIAKHEYYKAQLAAEGECEDTIATLDSDIDILTKIKACRTYGELYDKLHSTKFDTIARCKSDLYEEIQKWREHFKKDIFAKNKSLASKYFFNSEDNIAVLYGIIYKNGQIIYKFLKEFDKAFMADKRYRNIVEFRDAERYAYQAVIGKDGKPTEFARALQEKYSDVYIDEYQDVNALQGEIFEAISRPDNCFMVGDIKQSIYGFRSAKPDFFKTKKASFPELKRDAPRTDCATLFMSGNFRCDEPVINYVNSVFDLIFAELGQSIAYSVGDRLCFAKKYDADKGEFPRGHIPELHVVDMMDEARANADDVGAERAEQDTEARSLGNAIEEDELEKSEAMAALAVDKIASLINNPNELLANGKEITAGDIAIIFRTKTNLHRYVDALKRRGIEYEIKDKSDFFKNKEVLLTFSLLNAINNPRFDVYLCAVMVSPLFSFSFDELAAIKKGAVRGEALYDAVVRYNASHSEFEKGRRLIEDLYRYRDLSRGMSIDAFLSLLYKETGLLAIAGAGGRDNLRLLHEHARSFEASSFRGLYSFICYVNKLFEEGETFKSSDSGEVEKRTKVTLITAHSSKGLEFPVVFMPEAGKPIGANPRGAAVHVALANDFGIGFGILDDSGLASLEDSSEDIVRLYQSEREYEEELRVLYVTLTRARERLYIYGSVRDVRAKENDIKKSVSFKSRYILKSFYSVLDMLLFCRECTKDADKTVKYITHSRKEVTELIKSINGSSDASAKSLTAAASHSDGQSTDGSAEALERRFKYKYHSEKKLGIPEKLSVSVLTPRILDENGYAQSVDELSEKSKNGGESRSAKAAGEAENDKEGREPIPKFMQDTEEYDAAARGTATHLFMQFFNPEKLMAAGVTSELQRLTELGFLSKDDADKVNVREVETFARSELFANMLSAHAREGLFREQRFNVLLSASHFVSPENTARREALRDEAILVQGVIDCVYKDEAGELHIIDYKTDRRPRKKADGTPVVSDSEGKQVLIERHREQLTYYSEAVTRMFGKSPKTVGIYSLAYGEALYL